MGTSELFARTAMIVTSFESEAGGLAQTGRNLTDLTIVVQSSMKYATKRSKQLCIRE